MKGGLIAQTGYLQIDDSDGQTWLVDISYHGSMEDWAAESEGVNKTVDYIRKSQTSEIITNKQSFGKIIGKLS